MQTRRAKLACMKEEGAVERSISPALGHRSKNRNIKHIDLFENDDVIKKYALLPSALGTMNSQQKIHSKPSTKMKVHSKRRQQHCHIDKENVSSGSTSLLHHKQMQILEDQNSKSISSPTLSRRVMPSHLKTPNNTTQISKVQFSGVLKQNDSICNIIDHENTTKCSSSKQELQHLYSPRRSVRVLTKAEKQLENPVIFKVTKSSRDYSNVSSESEVNNETNLMQRVVKTKTSPTDTDKCVQQIANNTENPLPSSSDLPNEEESENSDTNKITVDKTEAESIAAAKSSSASICTKKPKLASAKALKSKNIVKKITQKRSNRQKNDKTNLILPDTVSELKISPISSRSSRSRSRLKKVQNATSDDQKDECTGSLTSTSIETPKGLSILASSSPKNEVHESQSPQNLVSHESVVENLEVKKTPVWKKVTTSPTPPHLDLKSTRKSLRLSNIRNKDVYDFQFNDSKDKIPAAKKRTRKRRAQIKRKKPLKTSIIKSAVLTTDPSWEPPISSIPVQSFYSGSRGRRRGRPCPQNRSSIEQPNAAEGDKVIQFDSHADDDKGIQFDSHADDDIPMDDVGYEGSVSAVNDMSSTCHINPSSTYNMPTPRVDGRFPGLSSTPRAEEGDSHFFNPFIGLKPSNPVPVKDDLKLCFGFDEPPEEDSNIGLSPVKKVDHFKQLHASSMLMHSNVEEIDPIPTRFVVPRFVRRPQRNNLIRVHKHPRNKKQIVDVPQKPVSAANESVLFDDIDENEVDDVPQPSNALQERINPPVTVTTTQHNNNSNSQPVIKLPSPEKSFNKPPRKSYDRDSLEAVRRKFTKEFAGGYPTTDSDTEAEDPGPMISAGITRRRKPAAGKQQRQALDKLSPTNLKESPCKTYAKKKKRKKDKKESKENESPPNSDTTNHKRKRTSREKENWDKSMSDWVSDINSHFSELEEVALVIE